MLRRAKLTVVLAVATAVVGGLLASYLWGGFRTGNSPKLAFENWELAVPNPPALNQTATFTFTIVPSGSYGQSVVRIVLGEGLAWVDDDSILENWEQIENIYDLADFPNRIVGTVKGANVNSVLGVPIRVEGTIKAVQTGAWNIEVTVASRGVFSGYHAVHVFVSENSAQVRKGYYWGESENVQHEFPAAPRISFGAELSFSEKPVPGKTVGLAYKVWTWHEMPDADIRITLPEGFALIEGNLHRLEHVSADTQIESSIKVRMLKLDNWVVSMDVESSTLGIKAHDRLYVYAVENDTLISRVPLVETVLHEAKVDESQIPLKYRDNVVEVAETQSLTIKGRFWYYYDDLYDGSPEELRPRKWAKIKIFDIEDWPLIGRHLEFLGETTTDKDGRFTFGPISNEDSGWFDDGNGLDIVVCAVADTDVVQVKSPGWLGGTYEGYTSDFPNNPDGILDVGGWEPVGDTHNGAWRVFGYINDGWGYLAYGPAGHTMGKVTADYPAAGSGYVINGDIWGNDWIEIADDHNRIPDIVRHEYGHFVMHKTYGDWFPSGPYPDPHYIDTAYNSSMAWAEGWASFFAVVVDDDGRWDGYGIENISWLNGWDNGDAVEGRVLGALYDIYDDHEDNLYFEAPLTNIDTISLGFKPIWDVFRGAGYRSDNFQKFWQAFKSTYSSDAYRVHFSKAALFQNTIDYNWAPDCQISDLTGTSQTSPLTLRAFAIEWESEDLPYTSMVFEYSLDHENWQLAGVDDSPTYVQTQDPPCVIQFSVEWDASHIWDTSVWVRATAFDGMENSEWSETGPFSIAPPPIVYSPTHPLPHEYYPDRGVRFEWKMENENWPIVGYSWGFDNLPSSIPDEITDTSDNAISLENVPDGIWYLHIRAVDNVGGCGDTAHLRIWIDTRASPEVHLPLVTIARGAQHSPAVTAGGNRFFVVWNDRNTRVAGKVYDLEGNVTKPEFTIAVSPELRSPSVAFSGNNFLVVWDDARSWPDPGPNWHRRAAIYDPSGNIVKSDFIWEKEKPGVSFYIPENFSHLMLNTAGGISGVKIENEFFVAWSSGDNVFGSTKLLSPDVTEADTISVQRSIPFTVAARMLHGYVAEMFAFEGIELGYRYSRDNVNWTEWGPAHWEYTVWVPEKEPKRYPPWQTPPEEEGYVLGPPEPHQVVTTILDRSPPWEISYPIQSWREGYEGEIFYFYRDFFGECYYEFYTIFLDNAGNKEPLPSKADIWVVYEENIASTPIIKHVSPPLGKWTRPQPIVVAWNGGGPNLSFVVDDVPGSLRIPGWGEGTTRGISASSEYWYEMYFAVETYDALSGQPLDNVKVEVFGWVIDDPFEPPHSVYASGYTGDGYIRITLEEPVEGSYRVVLSKPDYFSEAVNVPVSSEWWDGVFYTIVEIRAYMKPMGVEAPYGLEYQANEGLFNFHLRSFDANGKGSSTVHIGPFLFATPIELGRSVSGTISAGQTRRYGFDVSTPPISLTLDWQRGDLDLHLYDPEGRHVGWNYETNELELEIPGAEYSGRNTKPEWIRIPEPQSGFWVVMIYPYEAEEPTQYTLEILADVTPPESSVSLITPYWQNAGMVPFNVSATAFDPALVSEEVPSGVKNVELRYRYSKDNQMWSDWTLYGIGSSEPYSWTFDAPKGNGYYEFYSVAVDRAGNRETSPETILYPSDDTYVNFSSPNVNFGSSPYLLFNVEDAEDDINRAFLKFDLKGLPAEATVAASLNIYQLDEDIDPQPTEVRAVEDDEWTESVLTWSNQPSYGEVLDTKHTSAQGYRWMSWDVTSFVKKELGGDGLVSFCLKVKEEMMPSGDMSMQTAKEYPDLTKCPYLLIVIPSDIQADARAGVDTTPPESSVSPIEPYWQNARMVPFAITATTSDELSGVENVALWYRYSPDNSARGPWTEFAVDTEEPWRWEFTAPEGDGYYEFYSIAADVASNIEQPPATADAATGVDTTPPVSSVNPIEPYWHNSPFTITPTALDELSGVASVELWYRYSLDNLSWGQLILFGSTSQEPYEWQFDAPEGDGYYEFASIARDVAGNVEPFERVFVDAFVDEFAGTSLAPVWSTGKVGVTYDNIAVSDGKLRITSRAAKAGTYGALYVVSKSPFDFSQGIIFDVQMGVPTYDAPEDFRSEFYLAPIFTTSANPHSLPDWLRVAASVNREGVRWMLQRRVGGGGIGTLYTSGPTHKLDGVWRIDINSENIAVWLDGTLVEPTRQHGLNFTSAYTYLCERTKVAPVYTVTFDYLRVRPREIVADARAGVDTVPPTSSVDPIEPYWQTSTPFTVTATASDNLSGIAGVGLYYRHSLDNSTWGDWTSFDVDNYEPYSWSFDIPAGHGFYEFYSVARDVAGNVEEPPAEADARCATLIPATIDIDPDTLNLRSQGRWITAYIELLGGLDVEDIDVSAVALEGDIFLEGVLFAELHPTEIGDYDGDGVPDLMVKFDRSAVQELVSVGGNVELTVIGKWGPAPFRGSDTIRVIEPGEGQSQGHGNKPEVPPGQSGGAPGHGGNQGQGQGPPQTPPGQGGQPPGQGNDQSQDNQGGQQENQDQGTSQNQGNQSSDQGNGQDQSNGQGNSDGQGNGNQGQGNGQNQGNQGQGKANGKNK